MGEAGNAKMLRLNNLQLAVCGHDKQINSFGKF